MSHLFLPVERETHGDVNRRVTECLCRVYSRRFDSPASVVKVGDETHNSLDAVIKIDGQCIALELTAYRQHDPYIEREVDDSLVQTAISEALTATDLPPFDIYIRWREEQDRKAERWKPGRRVKVPHSREHRDFAQEFIGFVVFVDKKDWATYRPVRFCSQEAIARRERRARGAKYVNEKQFPKIAEYCESVQIRRTGAKRTPTLRTSLGVRMINLDEGELSRVIQNKCGKLPLYRKRAGGASIWLVVYCDGWPLSASLPKQRREEATQTIRAVVQGTADTFDQVWWIENTAYHDGGELLHVL